MRLTTIFALIVGMLIGIGGTMALGVSVPTANAGDWLAFLGALVGVVVTIIGTLWLEHYRATSGEREDRKIVLSSLDEIRDRLLDARQPRGDDATAAARSRRMVFEKQLLNSINKFTYARHYIPKRNIAAWQAIEELFVVMQGEKPRIEVELDALRQAGDNEAILLENIRFMGATADLLADHLQTARREIANA